MSALEEVEHWPPKHPEDRTELEDVAAERQVNEITEAEKCRYLQLIRSGLNPQEAANALDFKGRHFRALRSPQSPFFDEDFKVAFDEAHGSFEHAEGRLDRLRSEGFRRATEGGSDRLLIKLLEVYDPDWEKLRQKEVNVNVQVLVERVFDKLSLEQKRQLMAWLDELEGGVIDAEHFEVKVGELTASGKDE